MTDPVIHPAALEYPLLSDDELSSMADDIAAKGLCDPIELDQHGRLVDGRNRLEACRRAEVEPLFITKDFADDDEIYSYVLSKNVEKRSLSSGQKAMFRASDLARQGKREHGRWKRGSVDISESRNISTYREKMAQAGVVLDVAARAAALNDESLQAFVDLPAKVKDRTTHLDAAYRAAQKYEADAALKETVMLLPLAESAGLIEQQALEVQQSAAVIPFIEAPFPKQYRDQLDAAAKTLNNAAKLIRQYIADASVKGTV